MIGDDPVAGGLTALRLRRGRVLGRGDQGLEQVGVEHRVLALQHAGHALQTHARIDAGLGQLADDLVVLLLELHEDQIPDLHEPVAVLVRAAGRSAGHMVAVVPEDFGAGAAGAVVAHGPEVVRTGDADDLVVREARDLPPDRGGLVVVDIDGDQKAPGIQPEVLRHQVPRALDGVFLEIVAEAEIPQHLEERQVPRGVADIVQVVVLAARAHALLTAGGARIRRRGRAGEVVLERHHARVDEHQRRVVLGHQGGRMDLRMAVGREGVQEGRADLFQTGHGSFAAGEGFVRGGNRASYRALAPNASPRRGRRSVQDGAGRPIDGGRETVENTGV